MQMLLISCIPSLLHFRVNPQAQIWWNQVPQCCSLYPHPPHSASRPRDLPHLFSKPSSPQPPWHHCCITHHSPCCPSHLLKVHPTPCHGHSRFWRLESYVLCFSLWRVDSVFSGGLLQPPVRMIPQPQQVRRMDPSSRFPSRSDRPELILRKDDRRYFTVACFCSVDASTEVFLH